MASSQIDEWNKRLIDTHFLTIIQNMRMVNENPLDDLDFTDPHTAAKIGSFVDTLLPEEYLSNWNKLQGYGVDLPQFQYVRMLVPDIGAKHGHSAIIIRSPTATLKAPNDRTTFVSTTTLSHQWMDWFEQQRGLNAMLGAMQQMKDLAARMNTYGQLLRLWPRCTLLLPEIGRRHQRNMKTRSRWPKGFEEPEKLHQLQKYADRALDMCLLYKGHPNKLLTHPQNGRAVSYNALGSNHANEIISSNL